MKKEIEKTKKQFKKLTREKEQIKTEKIKKKFKFASLELLKFIANVVEATFLIADKKALYRYAYGFGWNNRDLSRAIYKLKKTNYITTSDLTGKQSIELTNKAKIQTVEIIVKKIKVSEKNRFLSFDIPAKFNYNRNKFRKIIKKIGFVKVQQSLWVTNKDVTDLVEAAIYECDVEKYVAYIVSEQSDIDGLIKKLLFPKDKK